jgi:Mor family transcriptional regulator
MLVFQWCNQELEQAQLETIAKEDVVAIEKMETGNGTKIYLRDGKTVLSHELIDDVQKHFRFT